MPLLELFINGFITGIAVTLGTYLANKSLIKSINKLEEQIKKVLEKKNNKH